MNTDFEYADQYGNIWTALNPRGSFIDMKNDNCFLKNVRHIGYFDRVNSKYQFKYYSKQNNIWFIKRKGFFGEHHLFPLNLIGKV